MTSFKLPVVNIGDRQDGKVKPKNIINSEFKADKIMKAIEVAISEKFKRSIKYLSNPYDRKIDLNEISKFVLKICKNSKILKKKFKDKII